MPAISDAAQAVNNIPRQRERAARKGLGKTGDSFVSMQTSLKLVGIFYRQASGEGSEAQPRDTYKQGKRLNGFP
jgi:hypothetical protein